MTAPTTILWRARRKAWRHRVETLTPTRIVLGALLALGALLLGAPEAMAATNDLDARVLDEIKGALPYEGATVRVIRGRLSGKLRRRETYTLSLLEPSSWRAPVRAKLTTNRGRTLWYTATLEIEVPVLVLARPARRGESMVTRLERRRLDRTPRDAVFAKRGLEGLVARSNLRAGIVVKRSHGERPLVVRRGQIVSLIVRRGPIVVTDRGIAAAPGRIGDTIRVTSASTKKTLIGVIRAPSTVELP